MYIRQDVKTSTVAFINFKIKNRIHEEKKRVCDYENDEMY
jgi:hypothetical protein